MSSMWGFTDIVLEGESANKVYEILQRAKEESADAANGYCSDIITAGGEQYRFGHGLKFEYGNSSDDNEFAPLEIIATHPVMDYFALYFCPIDDDERTFTNIGNIRYEFDGTVLKISESTYAGAGAMLSFLTAMLGDDCPELYYWISNEADYIGETNDVDHKYFNPEAEWDAMMQDMDDYE